MDISHNIQFSHINDFNTLMEGKPGVGKSTTVKAMIDADARRASGLPVLDPVQFIEPMPNLAEIMKGRRA